MSADCPTPGKAAHASFGAARAHLDHLGKDQPLGFDWNIYHCKCGTWHIGHRPGSLARRARAALRRARQ